MDLVLVTKNVQALKDVASWASVHQHLLLFIDTGLPFFPFLPSRTRLVLFEKKLQPLGHVLNQVFLEFVQSPWFYVFSDEHVDFIAKGLPRLEQVALTVPRLASLHPSAQIGLEPRSVNPLFGTLYSRCALTVCGGFDIEGVNPDELALSWCERVTRQGWIHMRTYDGIGSCFSEDKVFTGSSVPK
jgi:hypothetical protein